MQMLLTFNLHPTAATICSVVVARGADWVRGVNVAAAPVGTTLPF